jgi:hypothetical protein
MNQRIAILSENPLQVSQDRIGATTVLAALLGGEISYGADRWLP